jgi:O-antigen/teichoic acid export membrane protein
LIYDFKQLLKQFGVNRAVFFGVLSKTWFAVGGAVTLFLIAFKFNSEMQGYYFTFYSLLSLQLFVELGLTAVIINFSSHEWSKLSIDDNGKIVGDNEAFSRLKSLVKIVFRWYRIGAVLLLFIMGIAGYFFFSSSGSSSVSWLMPWLLLCLATAINLSILPSFSILEGCNQVANVYFYRFIQEVVRSISTWIIILLGGGLWALSGSSFAIIIWAIFFLYKRYYSFFRSLFTEIKGPSLRWWEEVWPMQWRIAVSWLSGYFIYPFFTPVLFRFKGAIVAGQMGMSLSMVMALTMISSMWIITKAPTFGMLIAKKEYKKLDKLVLQAGAAAVLAACGGSIVLLSFIAIIYKTGYPLAERFLPFWPSFFLLVSVILMQISLAMSTYLRAHKKEPFMGLSLISALMTTLFVLLTVGKWGALGISISHFMIMLFFVIPYAFFTFFRCRSEWHSDTLVESILIEDGERPI